MNAFRKITFNHDYKQRLSNMKHKDFYFGICLNDFHISVNIINIFSKFE